MAFVSVHREGAVAIITMDDGKANAMSLTSLQDLRGAFEAVRQEDARAVALIGRPRFFSGGIDLKAYAHYGEAERADHTRALAATLMTVFAFPRPVVAGMTGHAIAGGALLALACDVRVMMPGAKVGTNEVALGVNVPDFGLVIAESAMPRHFFTELLLHGAMLTSEDALQRGVVQEVTEEVTRRALDRARGLAESVGNDAYAITKSRLRTGSAERAMRSLEGDIPGFVAGVTALATRS